MPGLFAYASELPPAAHLAIWTTWLPAVLCLTLATLVTLYHRRRQKINLQTLNQLELALATARQELSENQERLRLFLQSDRDSELRTFAGAFHHNPAPLAITTEKDERFLEVNDAFQELSQYPRNQIIGSTAHQLRLWPDQPHTPGTPKPSRAEYAFQPRTGPLKQVLVDSSALWIERQPCRLTAFIDISRRREMEEKLRQSEQRLQLVARATSDTVWELDRETNQIWWNEGIRTIFGYSNTPLPTDPRSWKEAIHPEDRSQVVAAFQEALSQGHPTWSAEYRFAKEDGSYADVTNRALIVRDPDGNCTRVVGAMVDITERKRFLTELAHARDAAVEALRLKSEFLANISHEVRTPLNGIVGMTVLLRDTRLNRDQSEHVETIHNSTETLLHIVNEILDFSKIEAGKVHFNKVNFDLRASIDATIEMVADRAQAKRIELVTLVDGNVPDRLHGDSGRLNQVISNLVVNALKFTEEGEVILNVSRASETDTHALLLVEVKDTGIGIPEKALPFLFQAFSQVDGSTTRKHGGTGLGLAISKQLVELMGGQIGVESTPGKGSTFWFTCRLDIPHSPNTSSPPPQFPSRRILIADHHAPTRQLLRTAVESLKAQSVATASAADALHCLRRAVSEGQGFDLAILERDLRLPDNRDLLEQIKADTQLQTLPVILVVPRDHTEDTTLIRSSGANALLSRPLKQRAITQTIIRLLGSPTSHTTRHWLDRPKPSQQTTSPHPHPHSNLRILVAEDNPINQRVALGLLHKLGYHAETVVSGTEVLHATSAAAYDVILMDCQLPEMDGFEATRQIRRRPLSPDTPHPQPYIIAMTAFDQSTARTRCEAAGMDDFVSKPIRFEALSAAMARAANGRTPPPQSETELLQAQLDLLSETRPEPTLDEAALQVLRELKTEDGTSALTEMIGLFGQQTPAQLEEISLALTRYDAPAAEIAAHSVKGSAKTMGATKLAELCAAIEEEAHNGSLQVASHLLAQAKQAYQQSWERLKELA
jgi:PAS domain S-box-containing protein